jgi:hypothetical protein
MLVRQQSITSFHDDNATLRLILPPGDAIGGCHDIAPEYCRTEAGLIERPAETANHRGRPHCATANE